MKHQQKHRDLCLDQASQPTHSCSRPILYTQPLLVNTLALLTLGLRVRQFAQQPHKQHPSECAAKMSNVSNLQAAAAAGTSSTCIVTITGIEDGWWRVDFVSHSAMNSLTTAAHRSCTVSKFHQPHLSAFPSPHLQSSQAQPTNRLRPCLIQHLAHHKLAQNGTL